MAVRRILTAFAFVALIAGQTACAPKPVPVTLSAPGDRPGEPEEVLAALSAAPLAPGENAPLPAKSVVMPRAGETNAFGVPVSDAMQEAYDAWLAGDGEAALAAIDRAETEPSGPLRDWHLSALRAQVLIAMGRASDAIEETERTETLERAAFDRDIFTRSLRGEALVWVGDYARAVEVLAPVAAELSTWRLPTGYGAPPSNIAELVHVTTAQLRTYTALAGQYLLRGRIDEALAWAERAETLYADVHYVSGHVLYGAYLNVHADSYYGRALNLSFLGAARRAATASPERGTEDFATADAFYDAIGYRPGKVTTQALRAWSLLAIGQDAAAEGAAAIAVDMAVEAGLADMVWRVQTLQGEALLAAGRNDEAETVFRAADAAVNEVSGALSSDRAKRRFGVGKADITYRLAMFDIAAGDHPRLFADMERGRARAFVDMLAGVAVAADAGSEGAREITRIDAQVRRLRLLAATGQAPSDEVDRLLERRHALLQRLAAHSPQLAEVHGVQQADLDAVRAALPEGRILVYGVPARAGDPLRFLFISPDGTSLLEGGSPVDLDRALVALTDAIALEDREGQAAAARAMRDVLGMPGWPDAKAYLVVPTGGLFFVPWSLVSETRPVAVLPNAGWVLRSGAGDGVVSKAVVVGDPAFGGDLPQLAGASAEAAGVAGIYGTTALSGHAATERAVRDAAAGGADLLHLATHGRFVPDYPLRSAVYLADPAGHARAVTAEALFRNPLRSRFVVLSGCETGMGRAEAGDDFLGLARSFYLGGAKGMLYSMWPVDDGGTRLYMETFHANLPEGAGQAWLRARDVTREAGYPPAVYGAFVLGGTTGQ